ncbi:MAG: hypothetical protein JST39_04125, partial [Bacteroidetes bacterium]|nr:hypothetical protein [Bacteroidota bacterium]
MQTLTKALAALVPALIFGMVAHAQDNYSLDMEKINPDTHMPAGWTKPSEEQQRGYPAKIDSVIKKDGRYSLSLEKATGEGGYGAISILIDPKFAGKKIRLTGYIKTDSIKDGYAGMWMRVDGANGMLAFDNMQSRGIKGTTGWTQYSIDLNYDDQKATGIYLGGL